MKSKRSYKVLWNVFLFVICGGSLIYGFVQQRRIVESKVQMEECKQQVDSLKVEIEKLNQHVGMSLRQLEVEKNAARAAMNNKQ